jgi:hypothetical protein
MPYWNCERCGARLYSAARTLKRQTCPVCQGRLAPAGDADPSGRFEPDRDRAVRVPPEAGVSEPADAWEHS